MSLLISLLFGIAVGVAYAFSGVKSPAPPIVALFGLLGILIGEQGVVWLKHTMSPSEIISRDRPSNPEPPSS